MPKAQRFPKRFYRRNSSGKMELKYEEKQLEFCDWCGTCFVRKEYERFCTNYCEKTHAAIRL